MERTLTIPRTKRASRKAKTAESGKATAHAFISYCLRDNPDEARTSAYTTNKVVSIIREGLPVGELEYLRSRLALPMDQLVQKVGLSRATFHRRKTEGRLASDESDRVVRFARLFGLAVKVLGDKEAAREWLTSPQFGLGGAVPLDYAQTEVGAREVENLLGRIEHGVYS